jgi:hypothetical protein
VRVFAAAPLYDRAWDFEQMAKKESLVGARDKLADLESHVDSLRAELCRFLSLDVERN